MRLTRHNGRAGKDGVFNVKHNDRKFDVENSEHIDPERSEFNLYWDCYQGYKLPDGSGPYQFSFEDVEKAYYFEHYSDYVEGQTARNIKSRHYDRECSIESLLNSKKTAPEETILQIGNMDEHVTPAVLTEVCAEFFEEFQKRYGERVHMLDWALHVDEMTPHIQERHCFDAINEYGELALMQDKALEQLGFELPHPEKKRSRHNNRKMVFDAEVRELFAEIALSKGLKLELEPVDGSVKHKEKQDFIIDNQRKKIAENEQEIQAKEQEIQVKESALEELTMKIDDVEAVVDEAVDKAVDMAYEKTVEVLTEAVKSETVKHDIDEVKDYGNWLANSGNPKETKRIGGQVVDAIVKRLEKASKQFLKRVVEKLQEPKNKAKVKEEVKERSKVSVANKILEFKKQIKESDQERPKTQTKKKDMEL